MTCYRLSTMAKTMGHTMRRYMGHKLYLAECAARKAAPLADNGLEIDVDPFWMAEADPSDQDDLDVGDLAYLDDLACAREHERALLASAIRCTCAPDVLDTFGPFCQWCDLASTYSDTYKERNGFRPRHHGQWTGIELWDAIHRLYAQPMLDD
jgi:hypothetical protein